MFQLVEVRGGGLLGESRDEFWVPRLADKPSKYRGELRLPGSPEGEPGCWCSAAVAGQHGGFVLVEKRLGARANGPGAVVVTGDSAHDVAFQGPAELVC